MSVDNIGSRVWLMLVDESIDEANCLSLGVSMSEHFTRSAALATSGECRSEQRGQIIGSMIVGEVFPLSTLCSLSLGG